DSTGRAAAYGPEMEAVWDEHFASGRAFSFLEEDYGRRLLRGERPEWRCLAGARFLYVDEHGDAQFCSAQIGRLGKPIVDYTAADLAEHRSGHKGCEPGCAILCTYRDSQLENAPWRAVASMARSLRAGGVSRGAAEAAEAPAPAGRRYLPVI